MKDEHSTKSTEYIDTMFHLKFCKSDLVFVLLFFLWHSTTCKRSWKLTSSWVIFVLYWVISAMARSAESLVAYKDLRAALASW